VHYHTIQIN